MHKVTHIAQFLRNAGFVVTNTTHFNAFNNTDAAVTLNDGRYVQIGHDYFIVFGKKRTPRAVLGPMLAEIEGTNLADLLHVLLTTK